MKIALFAASAYEAPYIEEWHNYYHKLGVDDIFVSSLTSIPDALKDKVKVIFRHHVKEKKQDMLFEDFIKEVYEIYDWILFFDIDEFLVIKDNNTNLKSFLSKYQDFSAIVFNWKFFGSKEELNEFYPNILNRFIHCQKGLNENVKLAVNLKKIPKDIKFDGPYALTLEKDLKKKFKHIDNVKTVYRDSCSEPWNYEHLEECEKIAYLAHFMTKSRLEYEIKLKSYLKNLDRRKIDIFDEINSFANEDVDTSARDFYQE